MGVRGTGLTHVIIIRQGMCRALSTARVRLGQPRIVRLCRQCAINEIRLSGLRSAWKEKTTPIGKLHGYNLSISRDAYIPYSLLKKGQTENKCRANYLA